MAISVGRGLSTAEIAAQLLMGVASVTAHIGHVFAKLEAFPLWCVRVFVRDVADREPCLLNRGISSEAHVPSRFGSLT